MYRLEPNRRRTSKQQYRSITRGATPTPSRHHHALARTTAATRQGTHKYLLIPHCEHIRYLCLHPPWQSRIVIPRKADMAQLVEHNLAKVGVAGSSPVVRSIALRKPVARSAIFLYQPSLPYRRNNKMQGKRALPRARSSAYTRSHDSCQSATAPAGIKLRQHQSA